MIGGLKIDPFNEAEINMQRSFLAVQTGSDAPIGGLIRGMIAELKIAAFSEELTSIQPSFLTVKSGSAVTTLILNEPMISRQIVPRGIPDAQRIGNRTVERAWTRGPQNTDNSEIICATGCLRDLLWTSLVESEDLCFVR